MIFEKVAAILAEYQGTNVEDITLQSSFKELGLDSLDTVEVLMKLEDEFGVAVEMSEELKTVGDVVSFIEANK